MDNNNIFARIKRITHPTTQESNPGIFMIVGLGNPGKEYAGNRHNIGFMAVEHLLHHFQISGKKVKNKAIISDGKINANRIIFVKPQTFMNLSGDAVASLSHFYKVDLDHLLILHDDIDLPFGTIRLRPSGGAGGQKGVASIIEKLGSQQFARLRVGIGRPPGRMDAAAYVLKDFTKIEKEELTFVMDTIVKAVELYLAKGIENAMNLYNGSINKEG